MESRILNLQWLPTEILLLILQYLCLNDLQSLACVNGRLREISIPILFRHVRFTFSHPGLRALRDFAKSQASKHVRILTYRAPTLLKPSLLDFEYFKCEILTPEAYSTATRQFYGEDPTGTFPPYMEIYSTIKHLCEDHQRITRRKFDLKMLIASLELLPRISELSIQFCESIDTGVWDVSCLDLNICDFEQSFNHHAQTVTEALRASKNAGIASGTISLDFSEVPFCLYERPMFSRISKSLKGLIEFSTSICVIGDSTPLQLLVDTGLTLKCLELRHLMIRYETWRKLLEVNRDSLHRIALYDTEIFGVGEAGSFSYEVSRQIRSIMFSEFQSTVKNEPGQDPMITTPGTNHVSLVWRKALQPIESREDEHALVFDTDGAISLTLFSSLNGSEAGPRSSSGDTDKTVTVTFRAYERGRWKKMCSIPVTKSDIREAQRVADQYAQAEHRNARFYDLSLRKVSVNWCVHAAIHDGTFTILMSLGRSLHITRQLMASVAQMFGVYQRI